MDHGMFVPKPLLMSLRQRNAKTKGWNIRKDKRLGSSIFISVFAFNSLVEQSLSEKRLEISRYRSSGFPLLCRRLGRRCPFGLSFGHRLSGIELGGERSRCNSQVLLETSQPALGFYFVACAKHYPTLSWQASARTRRGKLSRTKGPPVVKLKCQSLGLRARRENFFI